MDHLRTMYSEKYYHIARSLLSVFDKTEYSIIPIKLSDAKLFYNSIFETQDPVDIIYDKVTLEGGASFKSRKGDNPNTYKLEVSKLLNKYIEIFITANPAKNTFTDIKAFINNLLTIISQEQLSPIFGRLTEDIDYSALKDEIQVITTKILGSNLDSAFYIQLGTLFSTNLDKLLKVKEDGSIKIVWQETLRAHLGSGISATPSMLPAPNSGFFLIGEGGLVLDTTYTSLPSTYFEE